MQPRGLKRKFSSSDSSSSSSSSSTALTLCKIENSFISYLEQPFDSSRPSYSDAPSCFPLDMIKVVDGTAFTQSSSIVISVSVGFLIIDPINHVLIKRINNTDLEIRENAYPITWNFLPSGDLSACYRDTFAPPINIHINETRTNIRINIETNAITSSSGPNNSEGRNTHKLSSEIPPYFLDQNTQVTTTEQNFNCKKFSNIADGKEIHFPSSDRVNNAKSNFESHLLATLEDDQKERQVYARLYLRNNLEYQRINEFPIPRSQVYPSNVTGLHLHVNGMLSYFSSVGMGTIDFPEVAKARKTAVISKLSTVFGLFAREWHHDVNSLIADSVGKDINLQGSSEFIAAIAAMSNK